jgi:hypothetical protein
LIEEKSRSFSFDGDFQTWFVYTYGPNDSLKTISLKEIQKEGDWKQSALWEYIYDGNLLTQIKITRYALSEFWKKWNVEQAAKRTVYYPGVYVVDVTGATTNEIITYEYDAQRRLVKKSRFLDPNYVKPSDIWLYYYDQKGIPDIFTTVEGRGLLMNMYHHLHKDGKLVKYRHDNYGYDGLIITSSTSEYSYNKQGLLDEVSSSVKKLQLFQAGKKFFYNTKEKERTWHTEKYNYQDGQLASLDEKQLEGYTVTRSTGNDISVSRSGISYGSVQQTTTTTTVTPGGTYEKTKYKWNAQSTDYTYTPDGKLRSIRSGNVVTVFIYDSKGRLEEKMTTRPYEKDMKEPLGLRVVYRYRQ